MDIKNQLEIILITYNRREFLQKTLDEILADDSPVKHLDITILNNNSTDGTTELLNEYAEKYSNLKHICHKINIGGNANIVRALETAQKKYLWLLADNDTYDWTVWQEVEQAIEQDYDVIVTVKSSNTPADIYYNANLISGCIYKMSNLTETVLSNAYDNIRFLFPHLALCAKNINDNNRFYTVSKNIVNLGVNPDMANTFNRGMNYLEIPEPRRKIFWLVAYLSSIELISDKKTQREVINGLRHYHSSLFQLFRTKVIFNQIYRNDYFYNYCQIFRMLNLKQRIKFIFAYLSIKLSLKKYDYWFLRYEKDWIEYLEKINQKKFLEILAKHLKNKKVVFYGAGLTAKVLLENYDFSKFNIVGISDKKFETTNNTEFYGLKTFTPDNLKTLDYDVILFTLKEYKKIKNILKKSGCKKKMLSIIRKSRFALRT